MNRSSITQIITLLGLLVVLAGLYFGATRINFFTSSLTRAEEVQEATERIQTETVAYFDMLKSAELDTSLFDTPEYQRLVDRTVPLPEPVIARPNPFAPLQASGTTGG